MGNLPGEPVEDFVERRKAEDHLNGVMVRYFDPSDPDGTIVVKLSHGKQSAYELLGGKVREIPPADLAQKIATRLNG